MLQLPAIMHKQFPTGETVTVFQDDAQFWRFYCIPGFPTVRMDPNGKPVFQLIKYNLSDASREEDPTLPRGGGYMVFDSELKIKPEHEAAIKEELKAFVDNEWERLKRLPNDKVRALTIGAAFNDTIGDHWSQSGMEGTPRASSETGSTMTLKMPGSGFVPPAANAEAPAVILGEPLWKSGKVTMNAPQSAALVNGKIGERPASLIGNNVAAFSIDLTADGATFMEQALVGRDGRGATDLTPIQVEYRLTMLAKLPPAKMYVKFDAARLYHSVRELFHEHQNCSDDYFTSESSINTAIEAGLITIKIDSGGIDDPDITRMLMQQATSMVQELLTQRFAAKEKAKPEDWEVDAKDSAEVYRLKRETEVDMTSVEQTMELSTTTTYEIAPQGTLQAFFTKVQDMTPFVRVIDTNRDSFFKTLGLKARAFANWEEDAIAFVELEVKYEQRGEVKVQSFTFTPADHEPRSWDPALIAGKREFSFRWRVGFEGRSPGDWSTWEKSTTRDLNVSIETPGKLDVEVTGVGLDFENVLDAVLVHLRYEDAPRDVPLVGRSLLISKERPSGKWTRQLFVPWDKPVEYRVEYLLKSGTMVSKDWTKTDGPSENVLVSRPNVDLLDLVLIPAGRWTGVIQAVISLRYVDGTYQKDTQINFSTAEEFKEWSVLLLNNNRRKFEYKILATFVNGDVQETLWLSREGDQAVPVLVEGPPRLEVKVYAPGHDFVMTPLIKVDLEYDDAAGTRDQESLTLASKDDIKQWSIAIRKGGPRTYRYKVTYFPASADPVHRPWQVTDTEILTIDRYSVPKVGADFIPTLQDFALTPAVEVNLAYDDPHEGTHERATLVFTKNEKQNWFLPVPDTAHRSYDMTITWYYSDGHDFTRPTVKLEQPALVLPRPPRV